MKLQLVALVTFATCAFAAPRPWCLRPSQPCWKLKRAVEAFNAPRSDEALQARSTGDLDLFANAAYDQLVYIAAQSEPDPEAFYELHSIHNGKRDDNNNQLRCNGGDTGCWQRAVQGFNAVEKRWCLRPSQPCWKTKRAAELILSARDGAEEACGDDDDECTNAKRHLDGLQNVARDIIDAF